MTFFEHGDQKMRKLLPLQGRRVNTERARLKLGCLLCWRTETTRIHISWGELSYWSYINLLTIAVSQYVFEGRAYA